MSMAPIRFPGTHVPLQERAVTTSAVHYSSRPPQNPGLIADIHDGRMSSSAGSFRIELNVTQAGADCTVVPILLSQCDEK